MAVAPVARGGSYLSGLFANSQKDQKHRMAIGLWAVAECPDDFLGLEPRQYSSPTSQPNEATSGVAWNLPVRKRQLAPRVALVDFCSDRSQKRLTPVETKMIEQGEPVRLVVRVC